jgi:hypothetical protein
VGWLHSQVKSGAPLKVAVKVQHADVARTFTQDLAQCDTLSRVLAWLEPSFDMRSVLSEINKVCVVGGMCVVDGVCGARCVWRAACVHSGMRGGWCVWRAAHGI